MLSAQHEHATVMSPGFPGAGIRLRTYQAPLLDEDGPGVVVLHWARQTGKSFTLAAWAVDRLLDNPGWLVTVLSNSRDNGAEFVRKCAEVCRRIPWRFEVEGDSPDGPLPPSRGRFGATKRTAGPTERRAGGGVSTISGDSIESYRMEVRIRRKGQVGRIKVLAANPRTARGFSGDLILDEFAFHEDSAAIWEAAEPILASNPSFRCRIASTGNGKHNMFYRMANGIGPSDGTLFRNPNGFMVSRVTRTAAYAMGVKIYDLKDQREEITPTAARLQALDKRAYDQNYECAFANESMTLLTLELIAAAQSEAVTIDSQEWSQASLHRMRIAKGQLAVGNDIGRNRDLSMVTVIEREGNIRRVIAMLKMEDMRLPEQQRQLAMVCQMPKFQGYCGDMTGLGLGLVEYLQEQIGRYRIEGVNFSTVEPVSDRLKLEGRKQETARVTEIMAVNLLSCFEQRLLKDVPNDPLLTEDLRKPEKMTSPGGQVSIAAVRDEAGHADGFWSLALAVRAGEMSAPFAYQRVEPIRPRLFSRRHKGLIG